MLKLNGIILTRLSIGVASNILAKAVHYTVMRNLWRYWTNV